MPRYRNRRRRRQTRGVSKRLKTYVKSQVKSNIETKEQDGWLDQTVTISPYITDIMQDLVLVGPDGAGPQEIVGNEIRLQSLVVNFSIEQADSQNRVRMILFESKRDYQPSNGDNEPFFNNDLSIRMLVPLDNSYVGRVYMDKVFYLNAGSGQDNALRQGRRVINLKNRRMRFQQLAAGLGNSYGNVKLYCLLVSDSAVGPSPHCLVHFLLKYKDA